MSEATEIAQERGQRLPKEINGAIHAIGRRKESVARVYLKRGNGEVTVNGKPAADYFHGSPYVESRLEATALQPFAITNTLNMYDVKANVDGGGMTGQMEALKLGIARALLGIDPDYRKSLKDAGMLSRDERMVERKKVGLKKARRSEQFSKR
ncbi:MAG: 30S ribosomal protein S9 [Candidatus Bipolaricaulia bacterium]